jgi:hypothetical protein
MKWMVSIAVAALAAVALGGPAAADARQSKCHFRNGIEHIVYIQFDNVHLRRDNPNVPSDLEQMPNLLNFLEDKGTLFTDHHTPLISHTAVDIVTSLERNRPAGPRRPGRRLAVHDSSAGSNMTVGGW